MLDFTGLQKATEIADMRQYIEENGLLDEATFYGRNNKLIECEKQIQIIIDEVHHDPISFLEYKCRNAFNKIENIFQMLFGFDAVNINSDGALLAIMGLEVFDNNSAPEDIATKILDTFSSPGLTAPISCIIKYANYATQLGHDVTAIKLDDVHSVTKLKNGRGYTLRMFIGITNFMDYGSDSLTAREILAIMLHEVGHNFYRDPLREISSEFAKILMFMTTQEITAMIAVQTYAKNHAMIGALAILSNVMNRIPGVKEVVGAITNMINTAVSTVKVTLMPVLSLMMWTQGVIATIKTVLSTFTGKLNPFNIAKNAIDYDKEKYADAFATAYGYGTDLYSALDKFERNSIQFPYIDNVMIKNIMTALYIPMKIALLPLTYLDCHPSNTARSKNMVNYMREVDAKQLPPKLRKEYLVELNRMEQERLQVKEYSGYDAIKQLNKLMAIIEDFLRLSDPRDLVSSIGGKRGYKNLDKF